MQTHPTRVPLLFAQNFASRPPMPSTKERSRELYRLKKEAKAKEIEERKKKNSDRCKKYYLERKARKIMEGGTPQQVLDLLQSHVDHGRRADELSAQRDRCAAIHDEQSSKRHERSAQLLQMVLKYVSYMRMTVFMLSAFSPFFLSSFQITESSFRSALAPFATE